MPMTFKQAVFFVPLLHSKPVLSSRKVCTMTARDTPSGPHAVALCDCRLSDNVAPSLRLRLFYPTPTPPPSTSRARWFPPSDGFFQQIIVSILRYASLPFPKLLSLPLSFIANQPLPAFSTGAVLPTENGHPLLFFSHGLGGSVANHSNFCIDCASHGFIVVAPEHTDGTAFEAVLGSQSRTVPYAKYDPAKHGPSESAFRLRQIQTRCEDLASILGVLKQISRPRDNDLQQPQQLLVPLQAGSTVPDLADSINHSHVVLTGHSFGAATALLFGAQNNLLGLTISPQEIICLDGWFSIIKEQIRNVRMSSCTRVLFVDMGDSGMKQSIEARQSLPLASECPESEQRVDAVTIIGGRHHESSDFPLRIPRWLSPIGGLRTSTVDPAELLRFQNFVTSAFLNGPRSWSDLRKSVEQEQQPGIEMGQVRPISKVITS